MEMMLPLDPDTLQAYLLHQKQMDLEHAEVPGKRTMITIRNKNIPLAGRQNYLRI
jgi:hypothetical protein